MKRSITTFLVLSPLWLLLVCWPPQPRMPWQYGYGITMASGAAPTTPLSGSICYSLDFTRSTTPSSISTSVIRWPTDTVTITNRAGGPVFIESSTGVHPDWGMIDEETKP